MKFSNRNLMPVVGTALALSLTFTACVKNEESDGVKALRMAQAGLYDAKAEATITAANAEAAYQNALAAVQNALAVTEAARTRLVEAQAKAAELANLLKEATDANEIEKLKLKLEVIKQEQEADRIDAEAKVEAAKLNAKKTLALAEKELKIALAGYAREIAQKEDAAATFAFNQYKNLLGNLATLRGEVTNKEFAIAKHELFYAKNSIKNEELIEQYQNDKTRNEHTIARLAVEKDAKVAMIKTLDAVADGTTEDATKAMEGVIAKIKSLHEVYLAKEIAADKAKDVYEVANDEYNNYSTEVYAPVANIVTTYPAKIETAETNIENATQDILVEEDKITDLVRDNYDIEVEIKALNAELDKILEDSKAKHDLYKSYQKDYIDAQAAYREALEDVVTKKAAYDAAVLANSLDNTTANQTAEDNAEKALDAANDYITDNDLEEKRDDAFALYNDALTNVGKTLVAGVADKVVAKYDAIKNQIIAQKKNNITIGQKEDEVSLAKAKLTAEKAELTVLKDKYTKASGEYKAVYEKLYADLKLVKDAKLDLYNEALVIESNAKLDIELQEKLRDALLLDYDYIDSEIEALKLEVYGTNVDKISSLKIKKGIVDQILDLEADNKVIDEYITFIKANMGDDTSTTALATDMSNYAKYIEDLKAELEDYKVLLSTQELYVEKAKAELDAAVTSIGK